MNIKQSITTFSLILLLVPQAFAQAETEFTPAEISLRGTADDTTIELNWDNINGTAPYGYRILWSLEPSPTYPLGLNDYFNTIRTESVDTYTIDYFLNNGTYYIRLCVMDVEDNCLNYSNEVPFLITSVDEAETTDDIISEETEETTEETTTDDLPEIIEPEISLSDIEGHKNQNAIQYLYQHQVISGYSDSTFQPDQTVNRAELLKILVGGKGINPSADQFQNCFPDVTDEWFAPYICYAKTAGWVSGYPDGTFKPGQEVNKAEAIKMLINSQQYTIPESLSDDIYTDVQPTDWFSPYIKTAKDKGLLEEIGSLFHPEQEMTRAGISENIYRAMYTIENQLEKFPVN